MSSETATSGKRKRKKKPLELSPYDIKWLDAFVGEANFNMREAEVMCGRKHPTDGAIRVSAHNMFVRLKPYIALWMDSVGMSDERAYSKLMEKWDAKIKDRWGREIDDNPTQMKALEFVLKIKGKLNDKVPEHLDRLIELELARIAASRQAQISPRPEGDK